MYGYIASAVPTANASEILYTVPSGMELAGSINVCARTAATIRIGIEESGVTTYKEYDASVFDALRISDIALGAGISIHVESDQSDTSFSINGAIGSA